MIVADSSYLVEGLLREASLLEQDVIVAPDIALYEVINAIWKHEVLLKDVRGGLSYVGLMLELVSAQTVRFVRPDERIIRAAYALALRGKCTFYDAVYVALAQDLHLGFETFDEAQRSLMRLPAGEG